ncbi:MAG TPA: alpha/beta hydrolase, partial [Candidatus Binataceae bacterium]|nr:alpha/beta hydrolase [Candidatus Binataceae bacterium]
MPHARINGIDLYYETHGEGPALVLAHGGGGNHLSWWQQVPALSPQYRCVTFDHRGFGESRDVTDGPGPNAYVEDLRQLLDHLGIAKAALVGQSMGGWTVLGFAAAFPERASALVLCDTSAGMDDAEVIRAQAA